MNAVSTIIGLAIMAAAAYLATEQVNLAAITQPYWQAIGALL